MAFTLKRVLYMLFTCTSLLANAKPTDRFKWNLDLWFFINCRPISLWHSVTPKLQTQIKMKHTRDHFFIWHLLAVTSCRLVYGNICQNILYLANKYQLIHRSDFNQSSEITINIWPTILGITDFKPPLMNYKNGMGKQRRGVLKTTNDPRKKYFKIFWGR